MAKRFAGNDIVLHELLVDAAMDRFESIVEGYDGTTGQLDGWIIYKLKFIMYKRVRPFKCKRAKIRSFTDIFEFLPDDQFTTPADNGEQFEVQELLSRVSKEECEIIVWGDDALGLSFQQIADAIGVSRNTARTFYLAAIDAVRAAAQ